MLVPVLIGALAVRLHDFTGYGGVVAFAVPYAAVYALFVYRFAMNGEERELVRAVGRRLRGGAGAKR